MKKSQRGLVSVVLLVIVVIVLGIIGYFYFLKSKSVNQTPNNSESVTASETQTNDFYYKLSIQQKPGTIQTADTVEFAWSICSLSKNDVVLQLVTLVTGGEKGAGILIADNIQNTGKFEWKIPATIQTGEYRVYISSRSCNLGIYAKNNINIQQSVKPFAAFHAPKASENIESGNPYKIIWTSNSSSNVDIGYRSTLLGESSNIHWIAQNIKNSGSYTWAVPRTLAKTGWTEILIKNSQTSEEVSSGGFLIN